MNSKPVTIDLLHPTVVSIFKNWGYISFFGALALLITLMFFAINYAADFQQTQNQNNKINQVAKEAAELLVN